MPGLVYWPLLPLQIAISLYFLARSSTAGIGPAYWRALKDGYGGLFALRGKPHSVIVRCDEGAHLVAVKNPAPPGGVAADHKPNR